jgi:hypothetical protein
LEVFFDIDPGVYVKGPAAVMQSDSTAAYTFSTKNLPSNAGAISLTFSVADEFFTEKESYALNGWEIIEDSGWVANSLNWDRTVTLAKAGGTTLGNFDFFKTVLNCKKATGKTTVEVVAASVATPGNVVPVGITSFETEFIAFSRYDVNRSGEVDLADVAAAAYFYLARSSDSDWAKFVQFDSLFISPEQCDVNGDNIVDIEDLILILANYTV